jgi:hypothetical protein
VRRYKGALMANEMQKGDVAKGLEPAQSTHRTTEKRPYSSPQLKRLGSVAELTSGSTGSNVDPGKPGKKKG